MATCTSCGNDVTGKKFCQQCGTPVQPTGAPAMSGQLASSSVCPRCSGEVKPGAAFCMNCGTSLSAPTAASAAPSQPLMRPCPACHTEVPIGQAFCSNCGQSMQATATPPVSAAPASSFCTNCGHQNAPGVHFCANCGSQIAPAGTPVPQTGYMQPGQYPQQPPQYGQSQYGQPQYPQQYPQQYGQGQMGYQPQPMMGQQPMVLRCPTCMAMAPMGTPNCPGCRTSLAGVVPTPANLPAQGQQGGLGGFMQGDGGKYAMGALGGAAAVIGGEMLLGGLEHHHRHGYDDYGRRDEGMLGGLGDIANDIGLL